MKSREHKLDICFDFTRGSCRRGDGCRFSHNLPPGGVIPPRPKTAGVCFDYTKGICNRGDACRFSHDAQAVAAFAKREESGGIPTSSKALPKPLPVPAAKPAASSGSLGAPRRTGAPSHAIASNAKHAKHVGPPANASANASRRDEPGSIAKTNAPASPARANPWASVAAGAPALSALSPLSRGAETREAPSFRFGVAPSEHSPSEHSPFGNDRGAHRADVVGSSDASLAPNVSRPNFSFGSGTASSAESRAGPSPFGSVPSSGAGDVRGGAVGAPETAPRGFGNGGAREPGPPGPPEHLGVGSPPAFAGGGLGGLFGGNSASLFGNAFGTGSPGAGAGAGAAPVWGGGGFGALRGGVGGFGAFDGGASGGSY